MTLASPQNRSDTQYIRSPQSTLPLHSEACTHRQAISTHLTNYITYLNITHLNQFTTHSTHITIEQYKGKHR